MAEDIKQVLPRLFEELFAKGNIDAYDGFVASGYRSHDPLGGDADLARAKEATRALRAAFPDATATILGAWADGDTAIVQWRLSGTLSKPVAGLTPTGKRVTAEGITIGKFRDGKLVEDWSQYDALGVMRELGIAPMVPAAAAAAETRPMAH